MFLLVYLDKDHDVCKAKELEGHDFASAHESAILYLVREYGFKSSGPPPGELPDKGRIPTATIYEYLLAQPVALEAHRANFMKERERKNYERLKLMFEEE